MATALAQTIDADTVMSFDINPGTLLQFLEARGDKGPRLKCFEGSVTLVSPGKSHETMGTRLDRLILAICLEARIKSQALKSTTWFLPSGAGDTVYDADQAYYIQSFGTTDEHRRPDLAIEVVVSHSESKALRAGALLQIPELWVLDVGRRRLTFHHLVLRGQKKGTYRVAARSRAFPMVVASEVLDRLDDPPTDDGTYFENCRGWVRDVLLPRQRGAST
ncbi:MAG: Uma2 family endonuclease [Isosphaeraceae bacterium]